MHKEQSDGYRKAALSPLFEAHQVMPGSEIFIRQVQSREDCHAEAIGGTDLRGDQIHLLVHEIGRLAGLIFVPASLNVIGLTEDADFGSATGTHTTPALKKALRACRRISVLSS